VLASVTLAARLASSGLETARGRKIGRGAARRGRRRRRAGLARRSACGPARRSCGPCRGRAAGPSRAVALRRSVWLTAVKRRPGARARRRRVRPQLVLAVGVGKRAGARGGGARALPRHGGQLQRIAARRGVDGRRLVLAVRLRRAAQPGAGAGVPLEPGCSQ
jgi:hypothetical protein